MRQNKIESNYVQILSGEFAGEVLTARAYEEFSQGKSYKIAPISDSEAKKLGYLTLDDIRKSVDLDVP